MAQLFINGVEVILTKSIPMPKTYQIADIENINSRKGNNSKTLKILYTPENARMFMACFDVRISTIDGVNSTVNFDPSKKARAEYYGDTGLLEFFGVATIKDSILNNGVWEFDIFMFSDFIDYLDKLNKVYLGGLDWDKYNHVLEPQNITDSWDGLVNVDDVQVSNATAFQWDGFGYYYGLIDYGDRDVINEWKLPDMIPQVWVYDILQMAFSVIGVTVDSAFFETQRFKRVLLAWGGGQLPQLTNEEADASSVYTKQLATQTGLDTLLAEFNRPVEYIGNIVTGSSTYVYSIIGLPYQEQLAIYRANVTQDTNSQVSSSTPLTMTIFEDGIYKIDYKGVFSFRSNAIASGSSTSFGIEVTCQVFIQIIINNVVTSEDFLCSSVHTDDDVVVFVDFTYLNNLVLFSQDELKIRLVYKQKTTGHGFTAGFPPDFTLNIRTRIFFVKSGVDTALDVIRDPSVHVANQDVKLKYFMPKMTCKEFFMGIINMFNLLVDVDPADASKIRVEPLLDYYKGTNDAINMTEKLDYSKPVQIVPTPTIASKSYNWLWKENLDLNNTNYSDSVTAQYGGRELDSGVDFAQKVTEYKLPFACIPVAQIEGVGAFGDLILPRVIQRKESSDIRYKGNPFLVMLGNSASVGAQRGGGWKLGAVTHESQPYVGHVNNPDSPSFDLTFKVPEFVFYNATGYTTDNLYMYHERFIKEIVDRFGKKMTAYFWLTSKDINELDFSKLWNVDGTIYRLQKIEDFDSTKHRSVKVELIKLIKGESIKVGGVIPVENPYIIREV